MKKRYFILAAILILVIGGGVIAHISCVHDKKNICGNTENIQTTPVQPDDSMCRCQIAVFDVHFKNKTDEINFELEDINWGMIDVDKPFIVNVSSTLFDSVYIFKIPFVGANMPMWFSLELKKDKLMFQVIQLINTVHSDEFYFEQNKKDKRWYLTDASHTIYTKQSVDAIMKYIFESDLSSYIDVEKMEVGECYDVKR